MNLDPARLFKLNPHNLGNKESRLYNTLKVEPRSHPTFNCSIVYLKKCVYSNTTYFLHTESCQTVEQFARNQNMLSEVKMFLTSKQTMIR